MDIKDSTGNSQKLNHVQCEMCKLDHLYSQSSNVLKIQCECGNTIILPVLSTLMNTLIPQIRARRVNSSEVVTGYYAYKPLLDKHFIVREETVPYSTATVFDEVEIVPETIEVIHNL